MDPSAHFDVQRKWYERYRRVILEEAAPITADSVYVVELLLMEAEVDAARAALAGLVAGLGPPPFDAGEPYFVRQEGTTCMSTSLGNGMISLGEPYLIADPERRVTGLADDIVASTSAMGKPGEYRSVDDMFKYLESGRLLELRDEGAGFSCDYTVRLTNSLIDVCEVLYSGRGRLVIQRSAHAHLGFGLEQRDGEYVVRMRDPMTRSGPGYSRVSFETLRRDYLWSPLKKIPRLMGPHGFQELEAEELLGHLERYDAMENLGVDCPSAILYRKAEAPALRTPPEEDAAG
ncbi:MAG: hypothetical protein AB7N76_02915 [Planctomycetota bacterium]